MSQTRIHYSLSLPDIPARRIEVALTASELGKEEELVLTMPSWVPGSYLMREYAGHVTQLSASADGASLPTRKRDKSTWLVTLNGAKECEIRYQVFAPDLSVRSNDLSHDHAFINPAGAFLAVEAFKNEAATVRIEAPKGWRIFTSMREGKGTGNYLVENYDELVDSPLELGPHELHRFEVSGIPHELVIHGEGNFDLERMIEDMAKICEAEVKFFGELPIDRYLFILLLTHDGAGGLEHSYSSALAWPALKFRPEIEYHRYLTLVAHEYWHLWNVKRLRPEVLMEYDYSREVYTRLLWVFEGLTNYYDELIPVRAGVYDAKRYLEFTAENIRAEAARPGHLVQSMGDASFDTWIKLYRPNPDTGNSQVSYYQRGQMAGLLLDLYLRKQSGDKRSLDDVMRAMYEKLYKNGKGLSEDGFEPIVRESTGVNADPLIDTLVNSTETFDFTEALAHVGLKIQRKPRKKDEDPEAAWLGAIIQTKDGRSILTSVNRMGSAHDAGLMSGDELIALDGHQITTDLEERLKIYRCGESVRWAAFRRGRLVDGTLVFKENLHPPQEIVALEKVSKAQKKSFTAWTGIAWPFDESSE